MGSTAPVRVGLVGPCSVVASEPSLRRAPFQSGLPPPAVDRGATERALPPALALRARSSSRSAWRCMRRQAGGPLGRSSLDALCVGRCLVGPFLSVCASSYHGIPHTFMFADPIVDEGFPLSRRRNLSYGAALGQVECSIDRAVRDMARQAYVASLSAMPMA